MFFPFSNKIKKLFNKYKKNYFSLFKNNIIQFYNHKYIIKKNSSNNKIKRKTILYNKNNNNAKSQKFIKKNINIDPLFQKDLNKSKNNYNPITIEPKMNHIKQLKINNMLYHTKKSSLNNNDDKSRIMKNINRLKTNDPNLKIDSHNHNSNRRLIKRTFYKKFSNVSPEYRNIELNINNNSLKNTIHQQKSKNLNSYSSSISIFFQTQLPESKINSIKNLVYISKNKKPRNSSKLDMFEKIKNKLINNFYLTICKCIKKYIHRIYWNILLFKLKYNKKIDSYNENKRNILKSTIVNITNKIKKKYFRKYRENILIEKIKTKLFFLTDYSRNNYSVFNSQYINSKKKEKSKTRYLFNIYKKYNIKNYFSVWKMNIYNNSYRITFPLYSTRSNYSKQNVENYIKKLMKYNKDNNIDNIKKEKKQIIYKRNSNVGKDEKITIKKNLTQSQMCIQNLISPIPTNKHMTKKYSKKKISAKSTKINNIIHHSSHSYKNETRLSSTYNKIKKLFDKINNKKLQYMFFNVWKTNVKKVFIKSSNKSLYYKTKFLKYFVLYLNFFLNDNKEIINNKILIGFYLFI